MINKAKIQSNDDSPPAAKEVYSINAKGSYDFKHDWGTTLL